MTIINQDRDTAVQYSTETTLYSVPAWHDGKIQGINLMLENRLLGTFDSMGECLREIESILACTEPLYFVSGFCEYDGSNWTENDEKQLKGWASV